MTGPFDNKGRGAGGVFPNLSDRLDKSGTPGRIRRAEGPREHLTDEADPLACWCQPYRDTEEPEVILHRKEAEA